MQEPKKVMVEEEVSKNESLHEESSTKGAFASSMIFVGGFTLLLYIAIYWLFMVRVDI
ncbi:hypothetical protein GMD78_17230 [Ornithinibacillus sp. L9]|uniref:Cytochrome c oxidase subunit 2A n=1 Tax=Ornithinibacillus caprae TaxID=2678566 RepID=A0A6N8FR08_9BACI|nr:hypothetical protein [Ornithinibacillus caprae]MUK90118.1 hypothetical protein [Ornithinibacillus caprae]